MSTFAEELVPTSYLEQEKAEWEQVLTDARNGEFENNEDAIANATEEIEKYSKALARRQSK